MNIGNINQNITAQNINKGNTSFSKASEPKDVFVKSSSDKAEPSLKSLSQKLTTDSVGKVLLSDRNDFVKAYNGIIDDPAWEVQGGIPWGTNITYDRQNKCIYSGLEDLSSRDNDIYHLTCFNTDGTVRWKFDKEDFRQGPVTDGDGNIYFTGKNNVYAVDKDGNEKWHLPLNREPSLDRRDEIEAKPSVSPDGTVFFVDFTGKGEDKKTGLNAVKEGKVKWTYDTAGWDDKRNSIFTAKDGSVYLTAYKEVKKKGLFRDKVRTESFFIGLKPDGKEKFRIPVEDFPSIPAGSITEAPDGTIYSLQADGIIKGYNPDGTEKFSRQITNKGKPEGKGNGLTPSDPPVVDEMGNLYLIADKGWSGEFICMDKNGNVRWRQESQEKYTTKPHLLPDGTIAAGMEDEHIHVFDRGGKDQKKFLIGGEERIKRVYGSNRAGDFNVIDSFAVDEKGRMFASAGSWVLAYDSRIDPMDQLTEKAKETKENPLKDNTIKLEKENVVIGGVKIRRNRTGDSG